MHDSAWDDRFCDRCDGRHGHSAGVPASPDTCDFCGKPSSKLHQIGRGEKVKHICPACEQLRRPGMARDPRTDPRLSAVRPDPRAHLPVRKFGHRG